MNSKLAVGWPVPSVIRPSLFCKVRQVVCPVIFLHPAGINHMGQIVLRVSQNKCRVTDFIRSIGADCRFFGGRKIRGNLSCIDRRLASGQTDKAFIEMIEPRSAAPGGYPGRDRWSRIRP